MDWDRIISRNHDRLLRIVMALFAYAGLDAGGADEVPRRVWRKILRLLRPAEAAVRRLIILAVQRIDPLALPLLSEGADEAGGTRGSTPRSARGSRGDRAAYFRLTDPPRRFDPRLWEGLLPFPEGGVKPGDANEDVDVRPLCRRILLLKAALDDLDGHAKRLVLWTARQARLAVTARRFSPIRRGHPPGHFKRPTEEIDSILYEVHDFAAYALRLDPG